MKYYKMNYFKVILYIIFSKRFRQLFNNTVLYAIINYEEKRGMGASDVLLFKSYYWYNIVVSKVPRR